MKTRLGPTDKIIPLPVALVVSGPCERPNIITVGKIGIMASAPPVLGISIKKDRCSLSLIRKTKEFSVNVPSADYCRETDYCGIVSGREHDKVCDIGMTPLEGNCIHTPILKECPFNLECRVIQEIVLGDWVMFLARICESWVDEDKLSDQSTGKIDEKRINPLLYCGFMNEYRVLGEAVGRGFHDGNSLKKKQ
jgi:flavin reductase (DIM6/NTAB) family NADH-FMN oxidoreductase RutF